MKQFTLSSLMQETHEDIKPFPNIKCIEKANFVSLPESENNEEEVDEVEKVDLDYDDLKSFLIRQEIPIDYKHTEIFDMATIGLYSKKYKQAMMLIQDELITRGRKRTSSVKVSNNKEVDQELSVAVNLLSEYLRFKDLSSSGIPHYTQSPRRLQIRKKVKENIKINGEKMKVRYAKRKRLQFVDFAVGDNVAVKIPPQDRGKCEVNRLPAVVVLKRGPINPKYKLACQFGTLESLFTASSLIPYPGPVSLSVEMSNTKISLREAARKHSVIKSDIIKCKCKYGCKTTHCICKRNNKMCLSHCHKGLKCSNGDEFDVYENVKKMFPKWGDKHTSNENDVFFSNTCTVDNWQDHNCLLVSSTNTLVKVVILWQS